MLNFLPIPTASAPDQPAPDRRPDQDRAPLDAPTPSAPVRLGLKASRVPARDGRSAEAVLMRRLRADLVRHVGGRPSATQRALIERAVNLTLQVARMDAKALRDGGLSDHATREYLAWSNTLTRTMVALGLDAAQPPAPTLAEIMARPR